MGILLRDGQGTRRDLIRAHAWLNLASAAAKPHPDAGTERDELAGSLKPAQLADAQRLARAWKPGTAMGAPRVKVVDAAPARAARSVAADDRYPERPGTTRGVTSCNTSCSNGSCFRTYDSGRKVHFQAEHKFNALTSQWEWDSGNC